MYLRIACVIAVAWLSWSGPVGAQLTCAETDLEASGMRYLEWVLSSQDTR